MPLRVNLEVQRHPGDLDVTPRDLHNMLRNVIAHYLYVPLGHIRCDTVDLHKVLPSLERRNPIRKEQLVVGELVLVRLVDRRGELLRPTNLHHVCVNYRKYALLFLLSFGLLNSCIMETSFFSFSNKNL